ncbi:MAG: four helix bundle protein [Deltaproteobacteria bacterium]|nr:four helix bundle protein [Deltaproteobacteria bacterium]MBW2171643.1 four helix bundle protein [Deltaproteobacteria bacterium]MBW2259139.1 four helix bundle protein [Deltaproteobacteria bacterium]
MQLKDLEVYRLAEELSDIVWNVVLRWDYFYKITTGKQMVEAADGIAANIGEGYGRYHYKENRNFCYYARGSLEETKVWLRKSVRRGLLDLADHPDLAEIMNILPKQLNAYIKSIGPQTPADHQEN